MKEQLATIRSEALAAFAQAGSSAELDALRVKYLGKKGELTAVLKQMGKLSAEERPAMGQLANEVRAALEAELEAKGRELEAKALEALSLIHIFPLPGIVQADSIGIHPLAVVGRQLQGGGTAPHLQILSPYVQGQLLSAVSALCSAAGGQGQAEYHH